MNSAREPRKAEADKIASPFVKWAGGKRNLVKDLLECVPAHFNDYYEPFLGGGALFFALHERLPKAFLSDTNPDLITAYNVIKKSPGKLIRSLRIHSEMNCPEYYYLMRSKHDLKKPVEIAGRFLYLNKTCYNGLYRVNRKGRFNVPVGRYPNPNIVQETNIMACSKVLRIAEIDCKSFEGIKPGKGDLVYCDPPYHRVNETSFTSYNKIEFDESDQVRLRNFALELHKWGTKVMLSNSNTKFIRSLYNKNPFRIKVVNAPRYVNCKSDKRSSVEELIITTYKH